MNRQEFLRLVSREIHFIFDRKSIEKELNEHLDDSIEDLKLEGLSLDEAEMQAVAQMGTPEEIGKLLNKEHHPFWGYVWMLSKMLVLIVVVWITIIGFDAFQTGLDLLWPARMSEDVSNYPIKMKCEHSAHTLIIDKICKNEGNYYLLYRIKNNLNYSRAYEGNSAIILPIHISSSTGVDLDGSTEILSYGYFGMVVQHQFLWPRDEVIHIQCRDGQTLQMNLGEYCHEKR